MHGIEACAKCGSRRLRWAAGSEGRRAFDLDANDRMCRDCQHVGAPLEFDSVDEWRRFADDRQAYLAALEAGWQPGTDAGR